MFMGVALTVFVQSFFLSPSSLAVVGFGKKGPNAQ
jgi:hypothetical protein